MATANIKPREAAQKMKEGYTYLDVRSVEEFADGHAKGAFNIPIFINTAGGRQFNPEFIEKVQEKFSPETKLVIGCHSGGRSGKACQLLAEIGFKDLFNIDGGFGGRLDPSSGSPIKGWKEEGLPCD